MKFLIGPAAAVALALPALAQETVTIAVEESADFGQYLTADGLPVYQFTSDTQATDGQEAQISCTDECLEAWPLVTSSGDPLPGEGIDASLLGTMEHDGRQVVTFDGWPLYHFIRDGDAEEPQGNDIESFGGQWSLLPPTSEAQAGDIAAVETLFAEACAQCHGRTGRGMASFPSLRGRDADYLATRLAQYRAGETVGPNSPLMWPVAEGLSDDDIADLAAHISANYQ
jgi:cytochrome c553